MPKKQSKAFEIMLKRKELLRSLSDDDHLKDTAKARRVRVRAKKLLDEASKEKPMSLDEVHALAML